MTSTRPETLLHGGDLDAARRKFPNAPEPWIDLSTGINPDAYPVPELGAEVCSRLPQYSDELLLREIAARRYGAVSADMVVAAPGTQALIQVIPRLVAPTRVAVIGPTYGEHAAAWLREGHAVADVADIAAIGGARIVVAVNPDNPTGRVIAADELRALAAALADRGGLLVVDEAFADVMPPASSVVPDLPPGTIVLRSFGKTYGLAGVRLGFAIAHPVEAVRLRDRLGPWSVSGPALAIGIQALADGAWLERTRRRLEVASHRLDALLTLCGCEVIGGTPLFRLVRHAMARQIADRLGQYGIHVRRFEAQASWLRFGIPDGGEAAWQRLETALRPAVTFPAADT